MFAFPRVVLALASILILGLAAVIALPNSLPNTSSVSGEWSWTPFRASGGRFRTPEGWRAIDAFTTSTRHAALAVSEPICPLTTRVALLQTPSLDRELYVIHGTHDELDTSIRVTQHNLDTFAATRGRDLGTLQLADGSEAKWSVTRVSLRPGLDYEITYFVATHIGPTHTLLLSGGAKSRNFDLREFLSLAESVTPSPN